MTDWTTIADTQLDPKAPVTSELMTAMRDNPIAIAEGASGAPRIEASAFASSYYTAGGIGTYCFARSTAGSTAFGNTVAGSWLRPISAPYGGSGVFGNAPTFPDGAAQTGTWRAMGQYTSAVSDGESSTMRGATLWLRIS